MPAAHSTKSNTQTTRDIQFGDALYENPPHWVYRNDHNHPRFHRAGTMASKNDFSRRG